MPYQKKKMSSIEATATILCAVCLVSQCDGREE